MLCMGWREDGRAVLVGGADDMVSEWRLDTNAVTPVARHSAPVKCLKWMPTVGLLVTGSWDKTVGFHDPRVPLGGPPVMAPIPVADRVYSLDATDTAIVVAQAERRVSVLTFDVRMAAKAASVARDMASPLKFQTRAVKVHGSGQWFALGGIDGHVAMRSMDPAQDKFPNAWKCKLHRTTEATAAVNSVDFCPAAPHIMSTAGSDGRFFFTDLNTKMVVKEGAPW